MQRAAELYQACLIRTVEEELLRLFSAGKVMGTTHTCIGQEMSAVALAGCLDRERDIIFSNHRCHGHYLAWTDDVDGLIAEVMGKNTGVCAGLGGSQHLHAKGFFSNGVQGGIVPVAAGLAFASKRRGKSELVACCIGDGTLGEGVIYETFNIVVKWSLPLLIVLENNLYAQSTSQTETLAGGIRARAAAFGMATFQGDTWKFETLARELRAAVELVRTECVPAFVRVDTYRLAAHSKGDDARDQGELSTYSQRDPVNDFLARANGDGELARIRERVTRAVAHAEAQGPLTLSVRSTKAGPSKAPRVDHECATQLEAIN